MLKPFRQSLVLIILILLLPTVILTLYEIGSLRKNEQVIEEIYANQLDAILYSVNQYSDDVVHSWAKRIEACFSEQIISHSACVSELINEIPSATAILLFDRDRQKLITLASRTNDPLPVADIEQLMEQNDSILTRLQTYLGSNYRKIESFPLAGNELQTLVFAIQSEKNIPFIVILHNPEYFISTILDPKIQEIAQDKFYIASINTNTNKVIYSSDRQQPMEEIANQRPFWILPGYNIGIQLRDTTISDLVHTRSERNIILVVLIDLILITGIWFIYRNVRKQLELSQLKSDFVSNVSHEIRTPLALITMYIETLEMGRVKSSEKIQEYYTVIQQETQRLTGIVNKILSFSRIESGKRHYSLEIIDINPIVKDVYNSFVIRLDKEGFEHNLELSEDLPPVNADREAIADAIINLVDNAMKYSGEIKSLSIITSHQTEKVAVTIRDKGIGISESEQKHIFDKFYRVTEKNLALKAKGSGLGLSIVKHIMDAHDGSIEIRSRKGEGSSFSLVFPVIKT